MATRSDVIGRRSETSTQRKTKPQITDTRGWLWRSAIRVRDSEYGREWTKLGSSCVGKAQSIVRLRGQRLSAEAQTHVPVHARRSVCCGDRRPFRTTTALVHRLAFHDDPKGVATGDQIHDAAAAELGRARGDVEQLR